MLTPLAMVKMQAAMTRAPQSLSDLVLVTGLARPVVTRYVRELQAAELVHVGAWDRDVRGYPTIEKYTWGQGADAPCPRKHSDDAERMRKARAEKKESAKNAAVAQGPAAPASIHSLPRGTENE